MVRIKFVNNFQFNEALLSAKCRADCEVLNDQNRGFVNFYLDAKRYSELLKREIDGIQKTFGRECPRDTLFENSYI